MLGTRTVGNGLQEWVERWRAVRSQQCIEARQLGRATVASPCLASVADHFDATVRTLRSPAQRAGLDHAAMVRTLPDPEHCIAEPDDATHGVTGVGALVDAGVEVGTLVTIGDHERAWPALDAYAENARSINARYHEANALHWRGILLLREGELDEASVALGNAVADALEIDAHDVAIAAMLGALQVATAKGDVAAVETSAPMVRGYVERHDPKRLADLLRIEGTALVLGNVEERERGIDLLREAVRLEQRALDRRGSGSRERLSYALQALGQALMKIGEPDEAISILTESLRLHQGEFSSRSIRIGALREDIMLAMIADGRIADAMKLSVDLMAWRREQFGPRSIEDTEGMLKAVDALFEGGHSIEASMILGNLRSWLNDPRIEASYGDAIRQRIRQLDVDKDDSRGGE